MGSGEEPMLRPGWAPYRTREMSPHGQGKRRGLANSAHVGCFIPDLFRECLEVSHSWSFGFPCGAGGKESACQGRDTRDAGLIPGLGRPPGGGGK